MGIVDYTVGCNYLHHIRVGVVVPILNSHGNRSSIGKFYYSLVVGKIRINKAPVSTRGECECKENCKYYNDW